MRRAPVLLCVALAALGGCRTCIDADEPRNYACAGDAGPGECPGGWQCNTTWKFCFDPAKGEPNPCRVDEECGGGWRCTPDGLCGDPALEGAVSSIDVDDAELLHPLVFTQAPVALESSAPLRSADGRRSESLLAGRSDAGVVEVLKIEASSDPDGQRFRTSVARYAITEKDFAVTVARDGGEGVDEFLWSFGPGGVLRLRQLLDDGSVGERTSFQALTGATWVAPLLVGGAKNNALGGVAQVRRDAGLALVDPYDGIIVDGGVALGGREAAIIAGSCADGSSLGILAREQALDVFRQGSGGRTTVATFNAVEPGDLRLATRGPRVWVSWRQGPRMTSIGGLAFVEVTGACVDGWVSDGVVQLARPVCPPGLGYRSYDLVTTGADGPPELVTECIEHDDEGNEVNDVLFVGERETPSRYLPPRLVTRQGDQVFSRFAGGQVTQGPNLLTQDAVSLPQPPETLYPHDGGLYAPTERASFVATDAGLMIDEVPAWSALPARYVESMDWFIARSGVVIDLEDEGVVALPEDDWDDPSAYVLSELLSQADGGGVLVATHDDAFDVAELGDDQPTLVTRLKPSPATPILSLALQEARDGGTAEGYLVAGLDLFEVRAPTPRRWSATKVPLSGLRPVFAWFDHGRPRALLDDGTVMGLYTRVPLSVTLPDEVRAGGQLCGAPFALTASALYRLVPPASGAASARSTWDEVPLSGGDDETDFSRGRLITFGNELYVFSNSGATWKLSLPSGHCPSE